MVKLNLTCALLVASASSAVAFAPQTNSARLTKATQLNASNGDSAETVGKFFAAAALSCALMMSPTPALADGEFPERTFQ